LDLSGGAFSIVTDQ